MRQDKYKFAFLVHSDQIIDECKKAIDDSEYEIFYDVIDFETGPQKALACLESGYEVILCHGGTGDTIFRSVPRSVIKIERTDMDVLRTLLLARQYSNKIVLSSYEDEFHASIPMEMEKLLNIKVRNAVYDSPRMMRDAIRDCVRDGYNVLIGGGVSKRCMESYGGRGFIILPTQRSICLSLKRAAHLAEAQRQAQMRNGNMKLILEGLQEGVLCIDSKRQVIIANKAAYNLLNAPEKVGDNFFRPFFQPLGLLNTLKDLIPRENRFVKLGNEAFIATTYPLVLSSDTPCAVAIFRDAPSLQKINRKINKELYAKGLCACTTMEDIKGESASVTSMKNIIKKYALSDANIFIQGETGSGKELVAHALHDASRRRTKPFVAVNISSISSSLLESELFGYEEGAFTGAKRGGKAGFFEIAHQGTLFLDEIGDISEETQLRLLRVLENRQFIRVGGSRLQTVDVRVICATNRPLLKMVKNGNFRMDLYYRLSTFKISIPPLRDRLEDIPAILENLLKKYRLPAGKLSPEIIGCLSGYAWPGNIRELLGVFENYLLLLGNRPHDLSLLSHIISEQDMDNIICPKDIYLVEKAAHAEQNAKSDRDTKNQDTFGMDQGYLKMQLDRIRLDIINATIAKYNGDKKKAANELGIGYSSLCRLILKR